MTPTVAIINQCTKPLPFKVEDLVAAIQECLPLLQKSWSGVLGNSVPNVVQATSLPVGASALYLLDNSDQADALGYHEYLPRGRRTRLSGVVGFSFIQSSIQDQEDPAVTTLHELIELLIDSSTLYTCPCTLAPGALYLVEACDAVEEQRFKAKNGIALSNWVYPAWFGLPNPGGVSATQLDYMGVVQAPGQILAGGYISTWTPGQGWSQQTNPGDARALTHLARKRANKYSRLARHLARHK